MPRAKRQHLKQRKDGRFCCVYQGKQFMGATEAEALERREEYKRNLSASVRYDLRTVGEYAAYWLPIHKADVKASTYNAYASILNHIIQPIASSRLQSVTTDNISELFAALKDKSASYIHKSRILITAIFQSAVDAGYIARNPCTASSVKPPKGTKGTHRAITPDERNLILTVPHRMQLAALIMLYCGLRRGEVLALTADDINGDTLTVSKSVYYVSNQPIISKPKTDASIRAVPVPSILRPFLCDLTGFIYPGHNSTPATLQAFERGWESYMKAISNAAGKSICIRPHDLRISYCTAIRDAGVEIHQAMIWLGHADEKMILRIYDQPGKTRETEARKLLDAAFNMRNDMQTKK